jgi:hypothetical protein
VRDAESSGTRRKRSRSTPTAARAGSGSSWTSERASADSASGAAPKGRRLASAPHRVPTVAAAIRPARAPWPPGSRPEPAHR